MSKGFVPPRKLRPATMELIRRRLLGPTPTEAPEGEAPEVQPARPSPESFRPAQPALPMAGLGVVGPKLSALKRRKGVDPAKPTKAAKGPKSALPFPDEVVVVDTETTGISHVARLVEIGAVRVRGGMVVARFETLVNPEMKIPRDAMAVHGITDAMVARAPTADVALRDFMAFIAGAHLVAHNASFDRRIFAQELARKGLASPGLRVWCTMRLARKVFPGMGGYALGALARKFAIRVTGAHRAMADVQTTVELLKRIVAQHPRDALGALHGSPTTL